MEQKQLIQPIDPNTIQTARFADQSEETPTEERQIQLVRYIEQIETVSLQGLLDEEAMLVTQGNNIADRLVDVRKKIDAINSVIKPDSKKK